MSRAAIFVLLVVAAAVTTAVALAAQSPKALRAEIFATAKKQHSLHYVEQDAIPGLRQQMVSDVAGNRGIQRISFAVHGNGKSAQGAFTVLVLKPLVYFRADAVAMHDYLGFTKAQTASYQDKWIVVRPGQHKYKALASAVTISFFLHDIYPRAPLKLVKTSVDGHKVTGVKGTNTAAGAGLTFEETIFPDSKMRPFAVAQVDRSKGFVSGVKISRWNEAVHVQAPANPVPITTVEAG